VLVLVSVLALVLALLLLLIAPAGTGGNLVVKSLRTYGAWTKALLKEMCQVLSVEPERVQGRL